LSVALGTEGDEETVISVDTYKAEVARQALEAGASILNDVSAFAFDDGLLDVIAEYQPGYVLMHSLGKPEDMQNAPSYENVVDEILAFFELKMEQLCSRGLAEEKIVLDPGIGFGKLLEHNLNILNNIDKFATLGRPVYMGLSNKSLFGQLLGLEPDQRQSATQVATALLAAKGVQIHRVHEVEKTRQSLTLVQEISR